MKIKEKVLKEVVDKVIHLKSRNEIIPKVIDLTLTEVFKVIDDWEEDEIPKLVYSGSEIYLSQIDLIKEKVKELKQKLGIEVLK